MSHTVGSVIAEVNMTRAVFSGSILLIEGDHDNRFWAARIDKSACRIVRGGGRSNVLGAIAQLNARPEKGLVAIVDNDLDGLVGPPLNIPNVLSPDAHDLESMLIRSPALEIVLAEFGAEIMINNLTRQHSKDIRELLLERAHIFATVRWWLAKNSLHVPFERFPPTKYIDSTWSVDRARLIQDVALAANLPEATVQAALTAFPTCDPWAFCHGKDLVAVLAAGFHHRLLGPSQPGTSTITSVLRGALDRRDLEASHLGQALRKWEVVNALCVLKP